MSVSAALNTRIASLGIKPDVLAALAGCSEMKLRRLLNGTSRDMNLASRVYQILISLLNLRRVCAPLPLSMQNAETLRNVLIWIKQHEMSVAVNLSPEVSRKVDSTVVTAGVAALSQTLPVGDNGMIEKSTDEFMFKKPVVAEPSRPEPTPDPKAGVEALSRPVPEDTDRSATAGA